MRRLALAERPLLLAIFIGFGLWIALQLLVQAFWVVLLVLLAVLAATAMMPIVHILESVRLPPRGWRIPRPAAAIIIYVAGGLVFGLVVFGVETLVLSDLVRFFQSFPEIVTGLITSLNGIAASAGLPELLPSPETIGPQIQALSGRLTDALGLTAAAIGGVVGFFFRLFVVLTLALFLVIEADDFRAFIIDLFPPEQRGKVAGIAERVGDKIGRWVLGQLAVAIIAGTLAGIAAALFHLPYPVLIGLGTLLLDLAPAVGPGVMAIPVFFLGLSQSLFSGIAAAIVFLALAQFDGNVASPLITGRAVQLSPAIIIIAVTAGFALYGIPGALVSVPIAMSVQVLTDEVFLPWLQEVHKTSTK